MEEKIKELSILYELSSIPHRFSTLDEIFALFENKAVSLLGNDNCIFYRLNSNQEQLIPAKIKNKALELMMKALVLKDIPKELLDKIFSEETHILLDEKQQFLKDPYRPAYGLVLPIKINDTFFGMLYIVRFNVENSFSPKDIHFLNILRNKIELALDNFTAREELRLQHHLLNTMLDNLPIAVFMKELQGEELKYVVWNKAAEELNDYMKNRLDVGKTDKEIFPKEIAELFMQDDLKVMKSGKLTDLGENHSYSRKKRIVHNYKFPLLDSEGKTKYIVGVAEDITEKKKMEEDLLQIQKLDAVGKLAGGIAHDFNNILAGILGTTELMLTKESNSNNTKHLSNILTLTDRAAELTDQLLTFSRKGVVLMKSVDIHHCIHEALKILENTLNKNIRIQTDLKAESSTVKGNCSMLVNIFLNLAINARDAMPLGGQLSITSKNKQISEKKKNLLKLKTQKNKFIRIRFTDNGTGIAEAIRDQIFEPFFTTKRMGGGNGMGLSTVYGSTLKHNGAIELEKRSQEGSCFSLYFPVLVED